MHFTFTDALWAIGALVLVVFLYTAIKKSLAFYRLASFYKPANLIESFRHAKDNFPTHTVHKGETISALKYADEEVTLPDTYPFRGKQMSISALMDDTDTTGLLVMRNGTVLYEHYFLGEQASDRHLQFSVSKSFLSALVGIAVHDGLIGSIDEQVTKYLPEMKGTGYDGVSIRDALTMSTGIKFTEDYADLRSDVNRMSMAIGMGGSLDEFAKSLKRDREPGTYNDYISVNSHILGMILTRVTGKTLAEYLEEKLWKPMGMEQDAYYLVDGKGMEVAMGGLQVCLRDMARFGQLYLNKGRWGDKQLVPEAWVTESVTPNAPHLMPGHNNPLSSSPFGYGFQWWTPVEPHGDFTAAGIYHQFIYVDPTTGIVIAKTSSNKGFNDPKNADQKEMIITAMQAISVGLGAGEEAPAQAVAGE
ncbi:serine hydrolase domain-containing protein [Kordiimonas marina]|uniref:serine hydrolase domain-containing protein n=1 Tax=Kordiimonas marina TaxID=2872312 RepID=UPI001FF2AB29|nr:serine hydrolase [Kordiimonas marina]MCJ9428520.1 beta-lactamase family protein [Kordiimonas marina]